MRMWTQMLLTTCWGEHCL